MASRCDGASFPSTAVRVLAQMGRFSTGHQVGGPLQGARPVQLTGMRAGVPARLRDSTISASPEEIFTARPSTPTR